MGSLYYVGPAPTASDDPDIQNRSQVQEELDAGISRSFADGRATTLATPKALKTYVDARDETFAEAAYYTSQDTLLIPNAAYGVPNGVASLNASTKVPLAQTPNLGVGYCLGPFGPSTFTAADTTNTPSAIAVWNLGVVGLSFKPLVFMSMFALAHVDGRPVVEVRIGTTAQTTYAAQTLVAASFGGTLYGDYQALTIMPAPNTTALMSDGIQTSFSPASNYNLTAWVYDANTRRVQVANNHMMGSAFLLRVLQ